MSALSIRIGRGASRLPADLALSLIPSLPRATLERLAQRIIDHLDDMDGDNDVEPNGDEEDGSYCAEDEHDMPCGMEIGAGCPASDPGEEDYRAWEAPSHDGEDQSVIILPAPKGIEPTSGASANKSAGQFRAAGFGSPPYFFPDATHSSYALPAETLLSAASSPRQMSIVCSARLM